MLIKSLKIDIFIWYYKIINSLRRDVNNFIKEQVNTIDISIIKVRSRKLITISSARDLFKRHITIKERLAKPKSKRLSAYILYNINKLDSKIDINKKNSYLMLYVTWLDPKKEFIKLGEIWPKEL